MSIFFLNIWGVVKHRAIWTLAVIFASLFTGAFAEAAPAELWKTGQTSSYAAGDDGDLEKGVAWPNPRFTESGDCVTDNLTGLMWAKNANLVGTYRTWQQALDYANNLTLCGYSDWSLPNRKQLLSLVNYGGYIPALPDGHPFINVQAYYWSSTTVLSFTSYAWAVNISEGGIYYMSKAVGNYVWPVRDSSAYSCPFSINPTNASYTSSGGSGSVSVTTDSGCAWTAVSNAGWITVTGGSSGTGSGTVNYSVAANTGSARTGTITIAGQTFTVSQSAISQYSLTVTKTGTGTGTVTATGCTLSWVGNTGTCTVTNGTSITLSGSANADSTFGGWSSGTGSASACTGTGDCVFNITQNSSLTATFNLPVCTYTITPTSASFTSSGGSGSVTVTAGTGCAWTAVSNAGWITVTGGASGTGGGTVNYSVAANTGSARTGTITIAGQTFTVTQEATAATYTISGNVATPASGRLQGSPISGVTMTLSGAGSGTAMTDTIGNYNFTGILNGSYTITPSKAGYTFTPASRLVTVNNANVTGQNFTGTYTGGGCTYSITPTSQNFTSSGGSGSVTVTAGTGCAWTAVSNAAWITVTGGASGTDSGTVNYSVAANTGSARTGTITIAGQTFTVTQEAAGGGGGGGLTIGEAVDNTDLTWTTGGDAVWAGQTTVFYNGGDAAKSGAITHNQSTWVQTTVTGPGTLSFYWKVSSQPNYDSLRFYIDGVEQNKINGAVDWQQKTFSILSGTHTLKWAYTKDRSTSSGSDAGWLDYVVFTGSGGGCPYSITPTSQNFTSSGGSGSVTVTAGTGCAWTAVSNAAWITVTGGASGTDSGTVNYSVAANTGSARTGTITIAGQTFTVTQEAAGGGGCTYSISPTSKTFTYSGGSGSVSVTAGTDCAWTASESLDWITITSGASGTGSGTVSYTVSVNMGYTRTGTITIAGQTFTVTQTGKLR